MDARDGRDEAILDLVKEYGVAPSGCGTEQMYEHIAATAALFGGAPRPCGHIFHRGDLVYSCRDCEVDGTCVLCESCFNASDHVGHNVLFHRTAVHTGGCCDCGDDEAWCVEGMCAAHRPRGADDNVDAAAAAPVTEAFPPRFIEGVRAIVDEAIDALVAEGHMLALGFDVAEREIAAHRADSTRAEITRPLCVPITRALGVRDQYVVYLLAPGKVRTPMEVTNALCRAGMSVLKARELGVRAVTASYVLVGGHSSHSERPNAAEEEAAGIRGLSFEAACAVAHILADKKGRALPAAIVPYTAAAYTLERARQATAWLSTVFVGAAPSLARTVCDSLCRVGGPARTEAALAVMREREFAAELWATRRSLRSAPDELDAAAAADSPTALPAILRKMRVKALKAQLKKRGVDSSACVEKRELVALLEETVCRAHASTGATAGGVAAGELASDAHAKIAAWSESDLRLDLLLRWHSRLVQSEAQNFGSLLAVLLPDARFKASLMECCVRQHARMMQDHVACVGPASGKILSSLTVQLYTVPSLVRAALSGRDGGIALMLLQCLYDALRSAVKHPSLRAEDAVLDLSHRAMTAHLYRPAVRDLLCVACSPILNCRVFARRVRQF